MSLTSGSTTTTLSGTPDSPPDYSFSSNGLFAGYRLTVGVSADDGLVSFTIQINAVPSNLTPLTVAVTETGLSAGPGAVISFESTNTAILKTASTAAFSTYYDSGNQPFALTNLVSSGSVTGQSTGGSHVFALGPYNLDADLTVPLYSVTKQVTLTPVAGAQPTLDGQVTFDVPEPGSLAGLGVGLVAFAYSRRRRVSPSSRG